jgi:hypothetical protein
MTTPSRWHVRTRLLLSALLASFVLIAFVVEERAHAAQGPTFKVAYLNVQSGKGTVGLPGRPVYFAATPNCTDGSQPLNAWGTGFFQARLRTAVEDPTIVALGVAEAWPCATPSNLRQALGWKAHSSERNGVALLARHGFSGPEEWVQLDTSLNVNPSDTMWVVKIPVCLDAGCSASINVFSAHWYAAGDRNATIEEYYATLRASYSRQAMQTAAFLQRAGGSEPHILIGDLNTWEGSEMVCGQLPVNSGLNHLRDAAYVDAWPLLHGGAEGFTGMLNRVSCGTPEGSAWKRPDYVWSPAHYTPVSIERFGMVWPGEAAMSDHYGLVAEFPWPGNHYAPVRPASIPTPTGAVVPEPAALYEIVARQSGKCIDVAAKSGQDGGKVLQWGCHGGANQQWRIEAAGDGYSRLIAQHSGKCLDVDGWSVADGVQLQQWACHGGENQQWALESLGDGYFSLVGRHSGRAVDVSGGSQENGAAIIQYSPHGGANQQWVLRPVGGASPQAPPVNTAAAADAVRFLERSTFGPVAALIARVKDVGRTASASVNLDPN